MSGDTATVRLTATGHPDHLTQDELHDLLVERFGNDPYTWAFQCPACGDVATGADMRDALDAHPRTRSDGTPVHPGDVLGQQCIGRLTGALSAPADEWSGRGCNWCAFGLFRGPVTVTTDTGATMHCFPVAPAPDTTPAPQGDPLVPTFTTTDVMRVALAADATTPTTRNRLGGLVTAWVRDAVTAAADPDAAVRITTGLRCAHDALTDATTHPQSDPSLAAILDEDLPENTSSVFVATSTGASWVAAFASVDEARAYVYTAATKNPQRVVEFPIPGAHTWDDVVQLWHERDTSVDLTALYDDTLSPRPPVPAPTPHVHSDTATSLRWTDNDDAPDPARDRLLVTGDEMARFVTGVIDIAYDRCTRDGFTSVRDILTTATNMLADCLMGEWTLRVGEFITPPQPGDACFRVEFTDGSTKVARLVEDVRTTLWYNRQWVRRVRPVVVTGGDTWESVTVQDTGDAPVYVNTFIE